MLLSIHIPKTGGTKFLELLQKIYVDKLYLDYGTERDLVTARTCDPSILKDVKGFESKYSCIHGHYHYLKYKDVFSSDRIVSFIRNPVDRVISQYRHIAINGDKRVRRHELIMSGKMDVVHFSRFDFIGNAQSHFLEGIDFQKDNHLFLFSSDMQDSYLRLIEWLDLDVERYQNFLNSSHDMVNSRAGLKLPSSVIPVRDSDKEKIYDNCSADLDLYDKLQAIYC